MEEGRESEGREAEGRMTLEGGVALTNHVVRSSLRSCSIPLNRERGQILETAL